MEKQLQSSLIFFQPDRRVLGWVWVLKRVMGVITLGSLVEQNWVLAAAFVGIREALSAITDYAAARNPINTTQLSSPKPDDTPAVETTP